LSRYFNSIAGALAGSYAQNKTGPLRIIEVGAGTGGTTASILPRLPADRTEYLFTDVSKFFFAHADQRFREFSFLKYGLLDLEQSPTSQGYGSGQYDIVVAANVLHATKDLGQTLDFVRDLLAPDGMLILYEVTDPPSYFDVSIALIEGWQKFNDGMRGDSPLLPTSAWLECLRARGFQNVTSWPRAGSPAEVLGSKVFVARAPSAGISISAASAQPVGLHAGAPQPAAEETILQQLADAPVSEHGEMLVAFVRRHVARVLRRDGQSEIDRDHRLMDLGLDSLMAVELRNALSEGLRLSQPLSATLIFDYPSVADIASYLMKQLEPAAPTAETPGSVPLESPPRFAVERASQRLTAEDLEQLSDAEVERLLSLKLDHP
jgi:SAM-dependent methyltransferase/acyl carrier protein